MIVLANFWKTSNEKWVCEVPEVFITGYGDSKHEALLDAQNKWKAFIEKKRLVCDEFETVEVNL